MTPEGPKEAARDGGQLGASNEPVAAGPAGPKPPPDSDWSPRTAFACMLLVVALGLALRAYVLNAFTPNEIWGDEGDYIARGMELARSGRLEGTARPPGYIFFLSLVVKLSAAPATALRWAQIGLNLVSVVLLYFVARQAVGRRTATLAAALFALYPTFVGYTLLVYSETLYVCLFLAGTLATLRAWSTRAFLTTTLAGVLLGLSALVKPVAAPVTVLLAAGFFVARTGLRGAALRALVLLAAFGATVLPYAWRNYAHYDTAVLVDDSAARTLWHANHIEYRPGFDWSIVDFKKHWDGAKDPTRGVELRRPYAEVLREELAFVASHPGTILRRVPEKIAALWNPTTFPQRTMAFDHVRALPRGSGVALAVSLAISAYYAAVLFLGTLGAFGARSSSVRTYFLLVLAVSLLIHCFMVSMSRYRLPLMPFFAVFAADVLLHWRQRVRWRSWRTRGACVVIGALLLSWWPYLPYVLLEKVRPW